VIEVPSRQQRIYCQQVDGFHQHDIKLFAVPSGFLAFVVALEAVGVLNLPHSDSRERAAATSLLSARALARQRRAPFPTGTEDGSFRFYKILPMVVS
jgi:hypothetical protein